MAEITGSSAAGPSRVGLTHPSIAPYGPYMTSDGTILVAVQSEVDWEKFCRGVLIQPELADDPRFSTNRTRVRNRAEMDQLIGTVFAAETKTTILQRLLGAGLAYANVSGMFEYL